MIVTKITNLSEFPLFNGRVFSTEAFEQMSITSLGDQLICESRQETYKSLLRSISSMVAIVSNVRPEYGDLCIGLGFLAGFRFVLGEAVKDYDFPVPPPDPPRGAEIVLGLLEYVPMRLEVKKWQVREPIFLSINELQAARDIVSINELGGHAITKRIIEPWGKTDHLPEQMEQIAKKLENLSRNFKRSSYKEEMDDIIASMKGER